MKTEKISAETIAARWQEVLKETAYAFSDPEASARKLNALYDAIKHNRWLEKILENGMYKYKVPIPNAPGSWQQWTVDYLPAPVATNPLLALNETEQCLIKITLIYDRLSSKWVANCDFNDSEYFFTAKHPERDQAFARAVMGATCEKMAYPEDANE